MTEIEAVLLDALEKLSTECAIRETALNGELEDLGKQLNAFEMQLKNLSQQVDSLRIEFENFSEG